MLQNKLLIYLIIFISLIAIFSFFSSPFFQIRSLNFTGLNLLTKSELEKTLESYYQKNIWLIDKRELKKKILTNNFIKEVEINKKFPDKLMINITERIPLGKINNNGKYMVFTQEGFILEKGPLKTRINVPEIKAFAYSFANNRLVFSPDLEKIVQALTKIDQKTRAMILMIKLESNNEINLVLSPKLSVYLGSPNKLGEKFVILQSIITKIKEEKLQLEYIDLHIVQRPVIKVKK